MFQPRQLRLYFVCIAQGPVLAHCRLADDPAVVASYLFKSVRHVFLTGTMMLFYGHVADRGSGHLRRF